MVAYCLSAVHVVIICAPSMACSGLEQRITFIPWPARFCAAFAVAVGSISYSRTQVIPQMAYIAMVWNSDCAPLPIIAMVPAALGARYLAATADVAAVRKAVKSVISVNSTG